MLGVDGLFFSCNFVSESGRCKKTKKNKRECCGWVSNGRKNGWVATDPGDVNTLGEIDDEGIRKPGLVNILVCLFLEALTNVIDQANTPNYCN